MRAHRFFSIPAFRFSRRQVSHFFAPRKPRHRALRAVLALFGISILAALLVLGLVIGATMLTAGLVHRLLRKRGTPIASSAQALDGEYRVLHKPALSAGR